MRAWVRAAASSMRSFGSDGLDRARHAAEFLDLVDVAPGPRREIVREPFDIERTAPRIDHPRGAALPLQHDLGVAGDAGGEIGRQRQRLVERVGMQRLGAALRRRHRLDAGAGDIVEHVLRGERPAGGLAMGAQRERARVLRLELLHQLRPQHPRGAQLGHLHKEVHADAEEEREPRREAVDIEVGGKPGADIFDAVGERVGELEVGRRSGLLHVVAGDRDRVELRHMRRGVGEDVGDDAQRRLRRIDVGVAHHEFLEDVVLDRAGELFRRHALFLGGDDIEREHRQHGAVHGHRHRHPVERDAAKQRAHVVDRVDRDARHADVAGDARMIAVIAAMGGEIEGDREALLAGGEIAPVEGVRILGGGEAGILPDRPWLGDVHGRVGTAQIGRDAGIGVETVEPLEIAGAVAALHRNLFRREPGRGRRRAGKRRLGKIDPREIRDTAHPVIRSCCQEYRRRP